MFGPKPVTDLPAAQFGDPQRADYFYFDGRTIASPAFRILVWCNGSWGDPGNCDAVAAIADLFLDRWTPQIRHVTFRTEGGRLKTVPASDQTMATARRAIASAADGDDVLDLRLAGWIDAPHFIEASPCLRIGESAGLAYLTLELPHDMTDLVAFADLACQAIEGMSLHCAVAGFGYFMPDYMETLLFACPMMMQRNSTAIEVTPRAVAACLSAPGCRDAAGGAPLIADIGWRTMLGPAFLRAEPDLASPGLIGCDVELRCHNEITSITVGSQPDWGRVDEGGQTDAFHRVADLLRPFRIPLRIAQAHLFGAPTDDPERGDRIRGYLGRFDP